MIRVAVVGFGPEPGWRASSALQALETLRADGWRPRDADIVYGAAPCRWWGPSDIARKRADGAQAILLFGASGADVAVIARFGRNEADPELEDCGGYRWPGDRLTPHGPSALPAGMPAEALARALELAGLAVSSAAVSDQYVYNRCYYELLRACRTPAGMILLPRSVEGARGLSARFNRLEILQGVKAAIAFAASYAEMTLWRARSAGAT
jgi:pyrrolidone-carboxylate peptidase